MQQASPGRKNSRGYSQIINRDVPDTYFSNINMRERHFIEQKDQADHDIQNHFKAHGKHKGPGRQQDSDQKQAEAESDNDRYKRDDNDIRQYRNGRDNAEIIGDQSGDRDPDGQR